MSISPMLAVLTKTPFDRKGWIFEIKWDGYRALAFKDKDVRLVSRNQKSFNSRYPTIVNALKKLKGTFVIDGEIVVLDNKGRSNFQLLQNYLKTHDTPYYYVFDILFYNGKDLRDLPLVERKKILSRLIGKKQGTIRLSEHVAEKGKAFFRAAEKQGLEGIMAKKADSPYQCKRSSDWQKIKTSMRQEAVIGGFTEPKGSRKRFGSLLVGVYAKGKLIYAGRVGGGFNEELLDEVYKKLRPLVTRTCPFFETPRSSATWVKPKLVCEVDFAEWTKEGIMRQPIFKGLRMDKNPKQVVREA